MTGTSSAEVDSAGPGPRPLLPVWLLACYCCIVVGGGIVSNLFLVKTAIRNTRPPREAGWWAAGWCLLGQLALTDALQLLLVSGGELWTLRETSGPWRLPRSLCAPFMGLETALTAAQTYLLVALALHARTTPADPVPDLTIRRALSAVVPSALVWMLASALAVPRTFLAVGVSPRPDLPLCTLLPTSPRTGALEGPLESDTPWGAPWGSGGPAFAAVILCAAPALVLLATALPSALPAARRACRPRPAPDLGPAARPATRPAHQRARREWVRVSTCLSLSWLLLSLPRALAAAVHGLLPPPAATSAFRVPPLGCRALPDSALLAAAMLHYTLAALRPVLAALAGPTLRRALVQAGQAHAPPRPERLDVDLDLDGGSQHGALC